MLPAKPKKGESLLQLAAREQDARVKQNIIICAADRDWKRMSAGLAGLPPPDGPRCGDEEEK